MWPKIIIIILCCIKLDDAVNKIKKYKEIKNKRDLDNVDGRKIGIDNYVNKSQSIGK